MLDIGVVNLADAPVDAIGGGVVGCAAAMDIIARAVSHRSGVMVPLSTSIPRHESYICG